LQDWRKVFTSAAVTRASEVDGERVYLLQLKGKDLPVRTLAINAKTGLVVMEKTAEVSPAMGQYPVTFTFSDYRRVGGVMLPFRSASKTTQSGEVVTQFETATVSKTTDDAAFELEPGAGR
jgi:hypothetical protein